MLYLEADYRSAIKKRLAELKAADAGKYSSQSMAQGCRVDKTHLSHVLNGRSHFTNDQLHLACDFLNIEQEEREFIKLLHEHVRTGLASRRKEIEDNLAAYRRQAELTDSHLNAEKAPLNGHMMAAYYLDPLLQITHMMLSIEQYQEHPKSICNALRVTPEKLQQILNTLESCGMIDQLQGKVTLTKTSVHLSKDSPVYPAHKMLVRLAALDRLKSMDNDASYNFSVVFSAYKKTAEKIRQRFFQFLQEIEAEVASAPAKQVFQMNFDLIPWA